MNKKEQEIHSKQSTLQEITNYTSTGYSNSRLGAHFVCKSHPKIIKTNHKCGWFPFWF